MSTKCTSCGKDWVDHAGIQITCAKLRRARSALKALHIWASFENGEDLQPKQVVALTKKALQETEDN